MTETPLIRRLLILLNIQLGIISTYLIFNILYLGGNVIIPVIIAFFLAFVINGLVQFFVKYKVPYLLALISSLIIFFSLVALLLYILIININQFIDVLPYYLDSINNKINGLFEMWAINDTILLEIKKSVIALDYKGMLTKTVTDITGILQKTGVIFIYTFFILIEFQFFNNKIDRLFFKNKSNQEIELLLDDIGQDFRTFLKLKSIISLITASLFFIVFKIVGLNFALLFTLLTFLLNFIPVVGSFIASILPIIVAGVQFESFGPVLFVVIALIVIQWVVGQILDPKIIGKHLNLSSVVIVFSLIFWGKIWWIVGMFLGVPIMMVINLILSKFQLTRPLSILLSSTGQIKQKLFKFRKEENK